MQKLRWLTEDGSRLELGTHPVLRKARPWPEPAPGEHGSRGGQGRGAPRPAAAGLRPLPSSAPAPNTSPELAQTTRTISAQTCGESLHGGPSTHSAARRRPPRPGSGCTSPEAASRAGCPPPHPRLSASSSAASAAPPLQARRSRRPRRCGQTAAAAGLVVCGCGGSRRPR